MVMVVYGGYLSQTAVKSRGQLDDARISDQARDDLQQAAHVHMNYGQCSWLTTRTWIPCKHFSRGHNVIPI